MKTLLVICILSSVVSVFGLERYGAPALLRNQTVVNRFFVVAPERQVERTPSQQVEYFVLTPDGRLEKYEEPKPSPEYFVLTQDGRLQRLTKQEVNGEYFKLTVDGRLQKIRKEDLPKEVKEENGEYHLLLPNGRLQRVRYVTRGSSEKLTARVTYQDVQPIRGPIYTVGAPLIRVAKK